MQPFSYMLFFILVSILFPNNFKYEEGDWFTLSNPEAINSITSRNDEIILCSDNGIFNSTLWRDSCNTSSQGL